VDYAAGQIAGQERFDHDADSTVARCGVIDRPSSRRSRRLGGRRVVSNAVERRVHIYFVRPNMMHRPELFVATHDAPMRKASRFVPRQVSGWTDVVEGPDEEGS